MRARTRERRLLDVRAAVCGSATATGTPGLPCGRWSVGRGRPARPAGGGASDSGVRPPGGGRRVGRGRARGSDRGSATVWSVGAIAVLCLVFGIVLALGHAVVVRHRAAGGADLAALAAADHWAEGRAAGCARADRVARAQDARLVRCAITGEVADVSVASGNGPFTVEVRARAGPAGPPVP